MNADYMILIKGRHNKILSSPYFEWAGSHPNDWTWEERGNVVVKIDTMQLETELDYDRFGISPDNRTFATYFQTSDWENSSKDFSDERVNADLGPELRGTRFPPYGGWPATWTSLGTDTDDAGLEDNDNILEIFANDSIENLYMRIDIESLSIEAKDCYDFYFNSTDGVWYRVRLFRNSGSSDWDFNLDYISSINPPTDSDTWTSEETNTISSDSYDGTNYGFNFNNGNNEGITNSVLFWVKKDSLSQGYDLIEVGNTTYMFADTHDNGNLQNKQQDRGPDDTGDPDPTYSYTCVGIPEFSDTFIPLIGILTLFIIIKRKRNDKK
jgi:hypothetical protein